MYKHTHIGQNEHSVAKSAAAIHKIHNMKYTHTRRRRTHTHTHVDDVVHMGGYSSLVEEGGSWPALARSVAIFFSCSMIVFLRGVALRAA